MMPKFQLLLLDAGIVIELFRLELWEKVIEKYEITLSEIVAKEEVKFWEEDDGSLHSIDLDPFIQSGQVQCIAVPLQQIQEFSQQFDPFYLERFDPGETESLAYLMQCSNEGSICSGDGIVFKVLGRLAKTEQGISLEELLQKIGLRRSLDWAFTESFRDKYTQEGQQDQLRGRGLKDSSDL